jgi:hypothetical protein
MARFKRPRHIAARLPPDVLAQAARLPLAELASSGLMRALVDRIVNHLYTVTGTCGMVAYAALVVFDLSGPEVEVPLERYPERSATACVAQATACVHPIGCRSLGAAVDPGNGDWTTLEPGGVVISSYGAGAAAVPHQLRWTSQTDVVPCVFLRLLLSAPT